MYEVGRFVYRSLNNFKEKNIKGYDFEIRNPEYAREILNDLGNPDKGIDFILVSGSKGKSSISRMIASLLSNEGKRVGLFSSPHLVKFNERIRVDGKSISDEDFIRLANVVEPIVGRLEKRIPVDTYIGPRGILLAIALLYFQEKDVEIGVMEVGVGGYDEINILDNRWAVITPIWREFLDRIGPTLDNVVEHTVSVVKPKTEKVFVAKQTLESMTLVKKHLKTKTSAVYYYGKNYRVEDVKVGEISTNFTVVSDNRRYVGLSIPLVGAFQAENAATAIRVAEDLVGDTLTGVEVRNTLKNLVWPGRCEIVHYDPMVVLDGTIHRASAIYLKEWLSKWEFQNCSVIVSIPKDKDYKGVIEEISVIADRIITTKPEYIVREYPEDIEEFALQYVDEVYRTEDLKTALEIANQSKPDLILILGTNHIIGTAKRLWEHNLHDLGK